MTKSTVRDEINITQSGPKNETKDVAMPPPHHGENREKRCVNNNYPHYGLWGFQQRLSMYFYVFYA